jgi:hypothetical protein
VYGGAVNFRRVDELNDHVYRESAYARLDVEDASTTLGIHTYNRSSRFEAIDRRCVVPKIVRKRRLGYF